MPKAKEKYYAVKVGKEGPKIYTTWEEAKQNVSRFPGAIHKSFKSRVQAEQWLEPLNQRSQTNNNEPLQLPTPSPTPHNPPIKLVKAPNACDNKLASPGYSVDKGPTMVKPPTPGTDVPPADPHIKLSPEQQDVLDRVKTGENVFFTGAAGTGKSVLLREIIRWCRGEDRKKLAVTASTGIASVNIGGSTLHSWAGIGLGTESAERLVGRILGMDKWRRLQEQKGNEKSHTDNDWERFEEPNEGSTTKSSTRLVQRWREVEVLIIDEISMIDGHLFDKLEFVAHALRRNNLPFGGIQLVLSGDFCQLPPVGERGSKTPLFAFEAKSWVKCIKKPVILRKVFRQKEQTFVDMLNAMRFGVMTSSTVKIFKGLSREVQYQDGLMPTELFPTRDEVDTANSNRLSKISSDLHQYNAVDIPGWDENNQRIPIPRMKALLKNLMAPEKLILKVGAQVMLIKNLVQGELVNGSIGVVVGFANTRDAINQGASLGVAESSTKTSKNAAGLLNNPRTMPQEIPDAVKEHIQSPMKWPIVKFGDREVLSVPAQFEVNNAEGVVQARRDQVPLILAWALSIHKSQGQTLERVRVNMSRVFEKGQAYVALSRATSIERLQVLNFDPAKVQVHPTVIEWMKRYDYQSLPLQDDDMVEKDAIDDDIDFWGDELK